jgi:hypothetical protein
MSEQKSFFGSKMLDIEDSISIEDTDIIYYQNDNREQINETQEELLDPYTYSPSDDKEVNHTLIYDKSQTEFDKINNTKWILDINLREILKNYIFIQLKRSRAFEGILNVKTRDSSVNQSIYDYIVSNLLDRYKFNKIDLFIKYKSLLDDNNLQPNIEDSSNINYDSNISDVSNIENKVEYNLDYDEKFLKVNFKQSKVRSEFKFNYYFNIKFKKA